MRWIGNALVTIVMNYDDSCMLSQADIIDKSNHIDESGFDMRAADRLYTISDFVRNNTLYERTQVLSLNDKHASILIQAIEEEMSKSIDF